MDKIQKFNFSGDNMWPESKATDLYPSPVPWGEATKQGQWVRFSDHVSHTRRLREQNQELCHMLNRVILVGLRISHDGVYAEASELLERVVKERAALGERG